jgi:hypothetical protein
LWFQASPGKNVCEIPSQQKKAEYGDTHAVIPVMGRKLKIGGSWSRLPWAKSETPFPKQPEQEGLEARLKLKQNKTF